MMTAKHKAAIRRGIKKAAKARGAKPHWTKTKKGREHMRQMGLKRGELMRAAKLSKETSDGKDTQGPSFHVGVIYGITLTHIEYYATRQRLSPEALATELGELLRHSQDR
jgi:hypothetical protein